MADDTKIIAIGLLTAIDVERLGDALGRIYLVDDTPCFGELLRSIDDADREMWEERDRQRLIAVQKMPSPKG
jgi:hypothetical protein